MNDFIKDFLLQLQKIINANVIQIELEIIGINEIKVSFKENNFIVSTVINISLIKIDINYYAQEITYRLIKRLSIERYYSRAFISDSSRTYV